MIIKFNLIPKEKIEEIEALKERPYLFLKSYFVLLLIMLLGVCSFVILKQREVSLLEKTKKEKEEALTKYKYTAQKVKEMEKDIEELKKRIETLVALKSKQGKNLKNLNILLSMANPSKVIFTNLKLESSKANIKGLGLDMDFLAHYMGELEKNKEIVKNVNLKIAQQQTIGDLKVINFELEVFF
ncbi:MAG: PilN domain-containing protein [Caldimicrobium sp.]